MAIVYTALGVAAGLLGEGLAAALQNPWVLGAFGILIVAMALSMFGFYELQVPAALQSRLANASGRQSVRQAGRRVRHGRDLGPDRRPLRGGAAGRRAGLHQPDPQRA